MIHQTTKFLTSTTILAAAIMAANVQAATPAVLKTQVFGTGSSTAVFAGGATINKGANFLTAIPSGQGAGIVSTITPPAADVGKEADLYMVINAENTWYMQTPTGFEIWDQKVANLKSYSTKNLTAKETISATDLEAAAGKSFDGKTLRVHIGYMTDTSPLVYSSAVQFAMAAAPSDVCPVGSGSLAPVVTGGKRLCVLQGTFPSRNLHLTANFEYILAGAVFIGGDNVNPSSITMDAGVKVYGESGSDFLVINRGSKIHVNGSASAPVIMTSGNDSSATAETRGQWGGLIINGNAPINGCTAGTAVCEAEGEGSTGKFGGNNPDDNSGNLNYLQLKYAGFEITPDNELNGIAFQAVGRGTLVDYVQVHNNSDDGVEFFGGTVDAKHLYLSGNADDSLDWTLGWTGRVQHVVVLQTDRGDQGFEADSNSSNRDSLPRAQPKIANATLIGNSNTDQGILLREGTGANLSNLIVKGFADDCLDIDHSATFLAAGSSATALTGVLTMTNSVTECATNFREEAGDNFSVQAWFEGQAGNLAMTTGMSSYINSAAVNARAAATFTDTWFDSVNYIGAVKDSASDWTAGWTYKD